MGWGVKISTFPRFARNATWFASAFL